MANKTKRGRPRKQQEVEFVGQPYDTTQFRYKDLVNTGSYPFLDISAEAFREYVWLEAGGDRKTLVIPAPVALAVSKSGHRLVDSEGYCFFIPFGWTYLTWKPRDGQPHFVK